MKSYVTRQQSFRCQVGDRVKIFRKVDGSEWDYNIWTPEMDECIGKYGQIIEISPIGILIKVEGIAGCEYQKGGWYFPYTSLEIIR